MNIGLLWMPVAASLALTSSAEASCGQAYSAQCNCISESGGGWQMVCISIGAQILSIPLNVTSLTIIKGSLFTITNNSFPSLPQLTTVILRLNGIKTLEILAFSGLSNLTTLILQQNNIGSLPTGLFQSTTQLMSLDISNNKLTSLSADNFLGLGNLQELDLSGNSISTLPSNVFKYLTSLQDLFLDQNHLSSVSDGILTPLTSLVSVNFSANGMISLPSNGFFDSTRKLSSIDLSINRLTALSPGMFANLAFLNFLDLTSAALTCDCGQYAFRSWMDGPSTSALQAIWTVAPSTSGTCSSPQQFQGMNIINVATSSFICTTTTSTTTSTTAAPTTQTYAATYYAATSKPPIGTLVSAAFQVTTPTLTSISGTTLAIILAASIGTIVLMVAIAIVFACRRRCRREKKEANTSSDTSLSESHKETSPGGGDARVVKQSLYTVNSGLDHYAMDVPLKKENDETLSAYSDGGYYNGIAAGLADEIHSSPQRPPKLNGLFAYSYSRQNVTGKPQLESVSTLDQNQQSTLKSVSLDFYSSLSAISAANQSSLTNRAHPAFLSMRGSPRMVPNSEAPRVSSLRKSRAVATTVQPIAIEWPQFRPPNAGSALSLTKQGITGTADTIHSFVAVSDGDAVASSLITDTADKGPHSLPYSLRPYPHGLSNEFYTTSSQRSLTSLSVALSTNTANSHSLSESKRFINDTPV